MECATTTLLYTDRTRHRRAIDEPATATTIPRCCRWLGKQQNFINNISFSAIWSRIFSSVCLVFRGMFGRTDRVLDRFWKFNSLLADASLFYYLCRSVTKTWIVVSTTWVFFSVTSIRHAFPCKFLSKLTLNRRFVCFFLLRFRIVQSKEIVND